MMSHNGLTKLSEECSELVQVCCKKISYQDFEVHPDGSNLNIRMAEEIADVRAALAFVMEKLPLDFALIEERTAEKLRLYRTWDAED